MQLFLYAATHKRMHLLSCAEPSMHGGRGMVHTLPLLRGMVVASVHTGARGEDRWRETLALYS